MSSGSQNAQQEIIWSDQGDNSKDYLAIKKVEESRV